MESIDMIFFLFFSFSFPIIYNKIWGIFIYCAFFNAIYWNESFTKNEQVRTIVILKLAFTKMQSNKQTLEGRITIIVSKGVGNGPKLTK
jgi:hypothetical protein